MRRYKENSYRRDTKENRTRSKHDTTKKINKHKGRWQEKEGIKARRQSK